MSIFLYLLVPLVHILHIGLRWRIRQRSTGCILIKGSVVLKKSRVLDLTDLRSSVFDRLYEYFGRGITFQLVSATATDQDGEAILGDAAPMEGWIRKLTSINGGEAQYKVTFHWDESKGIPGAVIVRNYHRYEFRLQTLTINGVPGKEQIHFVCNSWIYPVRKYGKHLDGGRIFFANDAYLPGKTPEALKAYREKELEILRGDGTFRDYKVHDRVYDYDTYNDLGEGSTELGGNGYPPYPRRGRTGPSRRQSES